MTSGCKTDWLWTQLRHLPNQQSCNLKLKARTDCVLKLFFGEQTPSQKDSAQNEVESMICHAEH